MLVLVLLVGYHIGQNRVVVAGSTEGEDRETVTGARTSLENGEQKHNYL